MGEVIFHLIDSLVTVSSLQKTFNAAVKPFLVWQWSRSSSGLSNNLVHRGATTSDLKTFHAATTGHSFTTGHNRLLPRCSQRSVHLALYDVLPLIKSVFTHTNKQGKKSRTCRRTLSQATGWNTEVQKMADPKFRYSATCKYCVTSLHILIVTLCNKWMTGFKEESWLIRDVTTGEYCTLCLVRFYLCDTNSTGNESRCRLLRTLRTNFINEGTLDRNS
jgi:hypothetical protein